MAPLPFNVTIPSTVDSSIAFLTQQAVPDMRIRQHTTIKHRLYYGASPATAGLVLLAVIIAMAVAIALTVIIVEGALLPIVALALRTFRGAFCSLAILSRLSWRQDDSLPRSNPAKTT